MAAHIAQRTPPFGAPPVLPFAGGEIPYANPGRLTASRQGERMTRRKEVDDEEDLSRRAGRISFQPMYSVKEIFYTLQGEGAQAGRPAVFCRFAGCNLWSGREADRATAVCTFCDTDFV